MDSLKRKNSDESSPALYSNKSRTRATVEARVDPTYGQRSALPGLDDEIISAGLEEDLSYDDGFDAIAYLRAVRQEATGIPNLLVAPKTHSATDDHGLYNDGVGDFRGWYEDGAYVAVNDGLQSSDTIDDEDTPNPQLQHYDSILSRFDALRTQLQQIPPPNLVAALGRDHPIHAGRLTSKLAKWWIWHMRHTPPLPVQVASMDKATVLRLLGLLSQGTVLKAGLRVEVSLSQWVWSLLARLPDRGALTSEEIGVVRDLGKKAVLVGAALKERKDWEAGIQQVEAGMEGNLEEILDVVNEDEIDLDASGEMGAQDEIAEEAGDHDGVLEGILGAPSLLQQRADTFTQEGDSNRAPQSDGIHITKETNQGTVDTAPASESQEEDIEALKARLLERLDNDIIVEINLEPEVPPPPQSSRSSSPDPDVAPTWNSQATVDMILTIAGEVYGQRDLLEFRGDWGEIEII